MHWEDEFGMLVATAAKLHAGQSRTQGGVPYVIRSLQGVASASSMKTMYQP